jgi:hypothetical protein
VSPRDAISRTLRRAVTLAGISGIGGIGGIGALAGIVLTAAAARGANQASAAAPAATAAPTFASCDEAARADPASYDAHLCFYRVAQDPASGGLEAGDTALEHLATPLAHVVRGHLWLTSDEPRATASYRRAIETLVEARRLGAASASVEGEAVARWNLALILLRRGETTAAAEQGAALRGLSGPELPTKVRLRALLGAATVELQTGGDFAHIESDLSSARTLLPDGPSTQRRAVMREFANLRLAQSRRDEAAKLLEELHQTATTENDAREAANASFNLALARWTAIEEEPRLDPADHRRALDSAASATARAEIEATALGDRVLLPRIDHLIGNLARAEGRLADAATAYDRAIDRARAAGYAETLAWALAARAEVAAARGEGDARTRAAEAHAALSAIQNPRARALLVPAGIRAAFRLEPIERAVGTAFAGLDEIEALRLRQGAEADRIAVYEAWARDYRWVAGRLLAQFERHPEAAFAATERLRARALHEALAAARIPDAAAAKSTTSATSPITVPPTTLAELRRRLGAGEVVLLYQLDDDRDVNDEPSGGSWVLAVTAAEVFALRLGDRRDLARWSAGVVDLAALPGDLHRPAAARLGEALLGETLRRIAGKGDGPIRRLLIVADGALHTLPFELLEVGGRAIGLTYEIALLPSASFLVAQRAAAATATPRRGALLYADPNPPASPLGVSEHRDEAERGPLPYARREARAIARRAEPARLRLGDAATEARLREDLADPASFALVHFATHAVIDPLDPGRSAVLLSSDPHDDGRLEPAEVARLPLDGRWVTLSACRTAAGRAIGGEGPLSLARAFLRAGASAVIASRWPLRDDLAADFFADLHRRAAGQRMTLGGALLESRRRAAAAGVPAIAWGGVTLIGDPALPLDDGSPRRFGVGVAAVAIGAGVLLVAFGRAFRRSRRKG